MNASTYSYAPYDLLCFSHLRWDFVYQRPQHLMSRFAKRGRVFVIEEPIFGGEETTFEVSMRGENLYVVVPHIPQGLSGQPLYDVQRSLLQDLLTAFEIESFITWYYTPDDAGMERSPAPAGHGLRLHG